MKGIRYCLITGASSGLGVSIARRFSQQGFSLHLVARRKKELEKVCGEFRQHKNSTVKSWVCDLADKNERARFLNEFTQTCPHLDVLINNAACQGPVGPLETNDLEDWQNTLNLNLLAPVHICHQLLPLLKKALVRFSENLAEETRHFGIRVNCIAPGAMPTEMLKKVLEADKRNAGEKEIEQAKKVFLGPADVMEKAANLALFLASDESVGITGKLISALWDRWEDWPTHLSELDKTDAYTLRRITGKDRGLTWGDR